MEDRNEAGDANSLRPSNLQQTKMLKKSFFKVTNRGNVVKVSSEHYLRDDIPCGLHSCSTCKNPTDGILLHPEPNKNTRYAAAHVLLPDTNILLHHLDIIENAAFTDVILLQTVLDEVKNRSLPLYQKVRAMVNMHARRFFVFSNEHHRETYLAKQEGESDNDRNDRAIRKAAGWYAGHSSDALVCLLTNDRDNECLAVEQGIPSCSLSSYLAGIPGSEQLQDMLDSAMAASSFAGAEESLEYDEHLNPQMLAAGTKSGQYLQGVLRVSPYNPFEGTVSIDQPGVPHQSILIHGRMHMNRGINGDTVAVEMLPASEWTSTATDTAGDVDESIIAVEAMPEETKDIRPSGRIVGIVNRKTKGICASIDRKSIKDNVVRQAVLVVPMDRHLPRIRLVTRQANELRTQRIVVVIDDWPRNSRYPMGHYVKTLGEAGDKMTETEAILLEHDVGHEAFTPQVLSCLPTADWDLTDADLAEREDLRHLCICSVDPPGCTDIDDALHARVLESGNIEVGVHIADVTHFVPAGTPLDREAAARATTVYLVDRRIDMLPGLLGTDLCSLRSDANRLSFSCIWEVRPQDVSIVSTRFAKSIIRSRASLTYDQAQSRLDGPVREGDDQITTSLRILSTLAKGLKAHRIAAGSLTLASPEFRFSLDTETQNPVDVEMKELRDANSMVEEFMLLANISVARKIHEAYPDSALLRRHPNPPAENFEAINQALAPYGFKLDPSTSKALAASLDAAVVPEDPYFNRLVRIMTTRCMLQAVYFAGGTVTEDAFWHYGLACPIYTHFTSPIRRYADVIVHRQLAACLNTATTHFRDRLDPGTANELLEVIRNRQRVEDLASNINYRHRMAQQAQRSSVELFTHLYFRNRPPINEPAYVIKVMQNGFVVLIPHYGIEGLIHVGEECGLTHDMANSQFVKTESRVTAIRLFQRITVELKVEALEASQKQRLSITLVDPAVLVSSSDANSVAKKHKGADWHLQ